MFTNILIVEDEMIIALNLELKLKNLRHYVTGTISPCLDAIRFVNDNEYTFNVTYMEYKTQIMI